MVEGLHDFLGEARFHALAELGEDFNAVGLLHFDFVRRVWN